MLGAAVADDVINKKITVTEDMVTVIPDNVSRGILEDDVHLEDYKKYFDDDAWRQLTQLGMKVAYIY